MSRFSNALTAGVLSGVSSLATVCMLVYLDDHDKCIKKCRDGNSNVNMNVKTTSVLLGIAVSIAYYFHNPIPK
jgi:hypothetical protein